MPPPWRQPVADKGLSQLRERVKRQPRTVPEPRFARSEASPEFVAVVSEPVESEPPPTPEPVVAPKPRAKSAPRAKAAPKPKPVSTGGFPMANEAKDSMTLQVRRTFSRRVDDLIHEFKRDRNIKTSKVELVEMLLSSLPEGVSDTLVEQLEAFRQNAPRR